MTIEEEPKNGDLVRCTERFTALPLSAETITKTYVGIVVDDIDSEKEVYIGSLGRNLWFADEEIEILSRSAT